MSNKKDILTDENHLLAEVAIKVAAIEKILIKTGIITPNDLIEEMKAISKEVVAHMVKKNMAQTPDDHNN